MGIKERTAIDDKNSSSTSKQLWHLLRALYYILKHKLLFHLDHRLLLERSKVAVHDHLDSLTCRSMDPARAYYSPKEIEFSCSNTPTNYYNFLHGYNNHNKRKISSRRRSLEAEAAARVFMEMARADDGYKLASPIALSQYMRSPAVACWQRRVSDSPSPVREEEEEEAAGGRRQVDREAEEFIRRFYEQLRLQPKT